MFAASCSPKSTPPPPGVEAGLEASVDHRAASYAPGNGRFFYAAGTAATYTVPSGAFVTGLSCVHATGAGATLTLTPAGPDVTSPVTGPAIPIPAGGAFSLSKPLLIGQAWTSLGVGTTIVFSGTDSYVVLLYQGGGS